MNEVWNNIESGANSGWIYDPATSDYGWVVKRRNNMPECGGAKNMGPGNCESSGVRDFPAAWGDLIKFRINGTGGDWVMEESYVGVCTVFLLGNWCPDGHCNKCGRPHMFDKKGTRYLAFTERDKSIFKWNATQKKFVPCAGIVKTFVNVTSSRKNNQLHNGPGYYTIHYTWHDSNNDGSWMVAGNPDLEELTLVSEPDSRYGGNWSYNYFVDLMQDDFSFTGVAQTGYWQWSVKGMDAHDNPIYDSKGPQLLLNDPVILARATFNASSDKVSCPKCQGLAATHGGNEVTDKLGSSRAPLGVQLLCSFN